MLWQLLANGFVNGCLFALTAFGFALIYNTTRIFHIAHGAIYTVAAYLCYVFLVQLDWGMPLAIALALFLTGLLGALTEWFVYAPLERRRASLLVALLSSLGLYIALVNLIAMLFGNETKVLRPGVEATFPFGSIILTRIQLAQVITAFVLLPSLLVFLRVTDWGRKIRALRDNPILVEVIGINRRKVRLFVFSLGSGLAGVSAILSALDVGMDPHIGMPALLTGAVALIVGGVGTFEGPIVGAFLLGILQSLVIWRVSARWMDAVTFGLLIFFLLFRPQGLLGQRRRLEEAMI